MCPRNSKEGLERFLEDLTELAEPQGESWYAPAVHSLHDRFERLSKFGQNLGLEEARKEKYQRVILFT